NALMNIPRPSKPLPITTKQPTHLINPPHCHGYLKSTYRSVSKLTDVDVMEMVQGYWRSIPESPDTMKNGTEACTSTPPTHPCALCTLLYHQYPL
ncbi:hypothetical protein PAXRUDRAFT_168028, partial [Paxillus rubicundulus Ve08.2h10]